MKYYTLRLLNVEHDRVDRIQSNSMREAVEFFMNRKRMDKETFNKLYEVTENGG